MVVCGRRNCCSTYIPTACRVLICSYDPLLRTYLLPSRKSRLAKMYFRAEDGNVLLAEDFILDQIMLNITGICIAR